MCRECMFLRADFWVGETRFLQLLLSDPAPRRNGKIRFQVAALIRHRVPYAVQFLFHKCVTCYNEVIKTSILLRLKTGSVFNIKPIQCTSLFWEDFSTVLLIFGVTFERTYRRLNAKPDLLFFLRFPTLSPSKIPIILLSMIILSCAVILFVLKLLIYMLWSSYLSLASWVSNLHLTEFAL